MIFGKAKNYFGEEEIFVIESSIKEVKEIGEIVSSPLFEDVVYDDKQKEFMRLAIAKMKKEKINLLLSGYAGTGKTYCLREGTLIQTPNGNKKIEEFPNVDGKRKEYNIYQYDFFWKHITTTQAFKTYSGLQQVVKIHTKKGIIECSPYHKWFVLRQGKREIIKTNDLNTSDYLLCIK